MGCGTQVLSKQQSKQITCPQLIRRYIRKQLLGKGTYGQVYKCIDTVTNNIYAMKVIKICYKNQQQIIKQIQQLKLEISMLKKINHCYIVKYQNFFVNSDVDQVQIVMELAEKGSLKDYIQNNGALSEGMCAQLGQKILKALYYLHDQNIIHRDLKCANILLTSTLQPKISDFGTAKIISGKARDDIARLSASLKGTPFYMSPEVIRRSGHNQSADIWSFGCLMIQMVSGKMPWSVTGAKFSQILGYISSGVHPPFPLNLSKQFYSLLQSCLNPIPGERLTACQLLKHRFFEKSWRVVDGCHDFLVKKKLNRDEKNKGGINRTMILNQLEVEQVKKQEKDIKKQCNKKQEKDIKKQCNKKQQKDIKKQCPKKQQKDTKKQCNKNILQSHIPELKQCKTSQVRINPNYKIQVKIDHEIDKIRDEIYIDKNAIDKKSTINHISQSNKLQVLQSQVYEQTISDEQYNKDKNYIKNTLVSLKNKKYSNNGNKNTIIVKTNKQNLSMYTPMITADSNLKSTIDPCPLSPFPPPPSSSHNDTTINTMISRAQRIQYLQQQKYIQKQRQQQKKKWEEQLKQGKLIMRNQMSGRYLIINV